MSHFSVLVIGPDIERQLAPFQENNMSDCPKQYLAFEEDEDADVDEETGKKGYWENPNAKWDWYSIGGRWAGFFTHKAGAEAEKPVPHYGVAMGLSEAPKDNTADVLVKGDIDFEKMRADAAHDAALEWDFVADIFNGLPEHKPWSLFLHDGGEDLDGARKLYHAQPRITAWQEKAKATRDQRREMPVDLVFGNADDFLVSRADFIQAAKNRVGVTFAVVKDGKWYERGAMGWWGIVCGEKDQETWNSMFSKLVDELPSDTLLTVVDCHI